METLNWIIQVPKSLDCSPQLPCPLQAPFSSFLPCRPHSGHPCAMEQPLWLPTLLQVYPPPRKLLFTQSDPSLPLELRLHATSCRKPSGACGAASLAQSPSSCGIHAGGGCFLCLAGLQGRSRARSQPLCTVPRLDSCRKERIIKELERVSQMGLET